MASTYSALKIQLMATGENSGTWGNVTNDNLGVAIEEAIAESADVTFSGSNVSITLSDTNASQTARNLRLNLTGTSVAATQALTVPDIEKPYIINNGLTDDVEVKNSTGGNVTVPAGKTMWVYSTGAGVVNAMTAGENLTGLNASNVSSGTLSNARTNASSSNGASTLVARDASGNFAANIVTAVNINSATLASCTGLPISTGVSGLGTNVASFLATPSSSNLAAAVTDETGSGSLVFATSPTLVTPVLGTPTSGNLSNCTVDGTNEVGFRNVPAVGTKTTAYVLAVGDVGKYVRIDTGGSIEIPNSTFSEGDAVSLFNDTTGDITVTCTITTAYIAGADADVASVTLATRGIATIFYLWNCLCDYGERIVTGILQLILGSSFGGNNLIVVETFGASGTWTCPTGVTEVEYLVIAGGGAGWHNIHSYRRCWWHRLSLYRR
jgi:hypothetical protein